MHLHWKLKRDRIVDSSCSFRREILRLHRISIITSHLWNRHNSYSVIERSKYITIDHQNHDGRKEAVLDGKLALNGKPPGRKTQNAGHMVCDGKLIKHHAF